MPKLPFKHLRNASRIGKKLALYTIFFSSVITLLTTAIQLYVDYRNGIRDIHHNFGIIQSSYLPTLSESVWRLDEQVILLELDGVVKLPDIEYARVTSEEGDVWFAGERTSKSILSKEYPIIQEHLGKEYALGKLYVASDLDSLYARILNKVLLILGGNAIKTFCVSIFILILFYSMVTKRMAAISKAVSSDDFLKSGDVLAPPAGILTTGNGDEIDTLTRSINSMRSKLNKVIHELSEANISLRDEIMIREDVESALQESENLLQSIINNTPSMIYIKDREGRFLLANSRLGEMLGLPPERIRGRSGWDLFPRDIAEQHLENDRRVFSDGEPRTFDEVALQGEDLHHYLSVKFPIRDQNGDITAVAGISTDITDRRKAEEDLHQAMEDIKSANRSKTEFLANMSHEIRTPLNGIMGMMQLLHATPMDSEQTVYVETAMASSKRLTRLLSDILDLSKVEVGRLDIQVEPFAPAELVESIEQLFSSAATQKGLHLAVEIDPAVPHRLAGDQTRVHQVLGNLVGNALKFTEQGGVTLAAEVLPRAKPGHCRLLFTVADTGMGIDDAIQEKLFEPFTQGETKYRRQFQGAGLGLAISRLLVSLMGGSLCLFSEQGKGTTFRVSLPFLLADSEEALETTQEAVDGPQRTLEVLVVDDDKVSRFALKRHLEKLGHIVDTAANGLEALEALRRKQFDAAFLDIQMPRMDGLEATRAIRRGQAGENNRNLPLVAVTAYAMAGDKKAFLAKGMDDYVEKPIVVERLKTVLARSV